MATTLSTATLTVSIQEEITLNGTKQGASINAKFGKIKQVDERIFTISPPIPLLTKPPSYEINHSVICHELIFPYAQLI